MATSSNTPPQATERIGGDAPLVSIGLPVHNGEAGIRRALDSLLAQTHTNIELFVSDNASTDGTAAILREYATRDPRVTVDRNETDIGLNANLKKVVGQARGEYFMLAAHDDYWKPEFVERLVAELRSHPDCGGAMCAIEMVPEEGPSRVFRYSGSLDPNDAGHMRLLMGVASGTAHHLFIYGLYDRVLLQQAYRWFPSMPAGDRVFIGHLALAMRFRYVDDPLYVRSVHTLQVRERYIEDPLNRQAGLPFMRERAVWALGSTVLRSDVVPLGRKWMVVPAMARFFIMNQDRRWRRSRLYGLLRQTRVFGAVRAVWRKLRGR